MIKCSECWHTFQGSKCPACGHAVPNNTPINAHEFAQRQEKEAQFQQECRQWLNDKGITSPEMTREQKTEATAAYRKYLLSAPKPDFKDWARSIIADYKDGKYAYYQGYLNACEALRIDPDTGEVTHFAGDRNAIEATLTHPGRNGEFDGFRGEQPS